MIATMIGIQIFFVTYLMWLPNKAVGLKCTVSSSELNVGDVVTFYCATDVKVSSATTKLVLKFGDAKEEYQNMSSNVSLTTTLTAKDNFRRFICKERNGQDSLGSCNLTPLTIPTRVSIRSHQSGQLLEGDTAAYSCSSEAQPPAIASNYKWYFGGSMVTSDHSPRIQLPQEGLKIKIYNVSKSDNNTEVRCEVINSVRANGTASMILKIKTPKPNKAPPIATTLTPNNSSKILTKIVLHSYTIAAKIPTTSISSTDLSDVLVTDDLFTVTALEQADIGSISAPNFKVWYYNVIEGAAIGGFILLVLLVMFTSCLIGMLMKKPKVNNDWKEEQEREKRKLKRLSIIPDESRVGMTVNNAYLSPTTTEEGDTVGYVNESGGRYNRETRSSPPLTHNSQRSASLPLTNISTHYDDSSHQDYVNTFPRQHDEGGYINIPGAGETSNVFNFDQMQVNAYLNEEYNRLSQLYENESALLGL